MAALWLVLRFRRAMPELVGGMQRSGGVSVEIHRIAIATKCIQSEWSTAGIGLPVMRGPIIEE